jgi:predicted nucleotidyltransferase
MFYEELFRQLNKKRIDYVVVGGVALVMHGVVRFTADLDLMLHLDAVDMKLGNLTLPVISVEDMIIMKKRSDRPQDAEDIKALRGLQADEKHK